MNNIDFTAVAKRIRETRISKGLTQEYIAQKVGINTSHVSNIENGKVKISLSTLINICNALDVTVDYVLSSEYTSDAALDNEILKELRRFSDEEKEKILQIIRIL